jgi:hypothetical protein
MPSKKKKYNARFPAVSSSTDCECAFVSSNYIRASFQGRIKKIMQMDDDVGKIAHGVPVVIYILFILA